jgi:hypothetical protein
MWGHMLRCVPFGVASRMESESKSSILRNLCTSSASQFRQKRDMTFGDKKEYIMCKGPNSQKIKFPKNIKEFSSVYLLANL